MTGAQSRWRAPAGASPGPRGHAGFNRAVPSELEPVVRPKFRERLVAFRRAFASGVDLDRARGSLGVVVVVPHDLDAASVGFADGATAVPSVPGASGVAAFVSAGITKGRLLSRHRPTLLHRQPVLAAPFATLIGRATSHVQCASYGGRSPSAGGCLRWPNGLSPSPDVRTTARELPGASRPESILSGECAIAGVVPLGRLELASPPGRERGSVRLRDLSERSLDQGRQGHTPSMRVLLGSGKQVTVHRDRELCLRLHSGHRPFTIRIASTLYMSPGNTGRGGDPPKRSGQSP